MSRLWWKINAYIWAFCGASWLAIAHTVQSGVCLAVAIGCFAATYGSIYLYSNTRA